MKPSTRDNLIYLAVGLSAALLVAGQVFYSESHHHQIMVKFSALAFRAVFSMFVVGYFVGRETRKVGATLSQVILCVLVAGALQLAIIYTVRQYVRQLPGLSFVGLVTLETFLVVNLATRALIYLKGGSKLS
jgi:hypothetical protein